MALACLTVARFVAAGRGMLGLTDTDGKKEMLNEAVHLTASKLATMYIAREDQVESHLQCGVIRAM